MGVKYVVKQFIFPPSGPANRPLVSKGNGNGAVWGNWPDPTDDAYSIRIGRSYIFTNGLSTSAVILPFPVPVANSVSLIEVIADCDTGSVNLDCEHNGSGIAGLTGLTINPFTSLAAMTYTPSAAVAVGNNERFGININSLSGGPTALAVTFNFDITIS